MPGGGIGDSGFVLNEWGNEGRLGTLQASSVIFNESELQLRFSISGSEEKAYVNLEEHDIKSVVFVKSKGCDPVVIEPIDARAVIVGDNNWQRDVIHFLTPYVSGLSTTMRLGITHHIGEGTWSSLPHAFELNPELGFEEVFFHILSGGLDGREPVAWQRGEGVWHDGTEVDDMWKVKNHTFSTIPMGYHPVVGEPGVKVSYVWCYLAKHPHWEKI